MPCSDLGFYQVFKWLPANKMLRGKPAMDSHRIQGGVEILLVDSCYRRRNKFRPDGLLGWYADFTIFYLYLFVENGLIIDDVNCYKKGAMYYKKVADERELISERGYYWNIFWLAKKLAYKLRQRAGCTKNEQFCCMSVFRDV